MVHGEQAALVLVDHDSDEHLVGQLGRPLDDVDVSVRDRVERPGTHDAQHGATLSLGSGHALSRPSAASTPPIHRWASP